MTKIEKILLKNIAKKTATIELVGTLALTVQLNGVYFKISKNVVQNEINKIAKNADIEEISNHVVNLMSKDYIEDGDYENDFYLDAIDYEYLELCDIEVYENFDSSTDILTPIVSKIANDKFQKKQKKLVKNYIKLINDFLEA